MKAITTGVLISIIVCHGFGQSQTVQSDDRSMIEIRLTNLPMVVGLFERADRHNGRLYVALDKEKKQLEEIEIGRIRAVFLLQGNHEKLLNYLVGGVSGGVLGITGLFARNRVLVDKNSTTVASTSLDRDEVILWSSVGASVGLLVGFLYGKDEENVRAWPVYNLEFISTAPDRPGKRNLRDKENIYRIPAGAIIQVVMGLPE